ncbi:MAG: FAD/NAD(P)-binding protein [Oscillospiraceae bacterium]|nr:FAD/NAD(P)-binding protein [Oscillospiraceae bacterium]
MISHSCSCSGNPLIPQICTISDIMTETSDTKIFRVKTVDAKRPFTPLPGQLAMVSLPGTGEAMFSVTAYGEDYIDFAIKRVGELTEALHECSPGQSIGIRGPYGNGFPLSELEGYDLLFIGGGIGLAPLRSLIRHSFQNRRDYGHIDILYGARSPSDLVFKDDLEKNWPLEPDCNVHVTVDRGDDSWEGNVGFVPPYMEELAFGPRNRKIILCGPHIMIKYCSEGLVRMGFDKKDIITTLEMRMKCGIGKCGRCNIGSKFVCLDGPVFYMSELDELP